VLQSSKWVKNHHCSSKNCLNGCCSKRLPHFASLRDPKNGARACDLGHVPRLLPPAAAPVRLFHDQRSVISSGRLRPEVEQPGRSDRGGAATTSPDEAAAPVRLLLVPAPMLACSSGCCPRPELHPRGHPQI
jgi:hypothetical protein